MGRRARIAGLGMAVPEGCEVSNEDLSQWMDSSPEWVEQRTGIKNRYWATKDTTTSVSRLAVPACEEALADAGLQASDVDLIVFATLSPDASFPGSGCFLQHHLGLSGIPALDIRQQCTGFLHGLELADLYVRAGVHEHVLLVGAEMQSKCLDVSTRGRDMTVLFGDGAGAVVVSAVEVADESPRSPESFVRSCHMHADGEHARELLWESPGTANRIWNPPELVESTEVFPQMNGRLVFAHATRRMPEVTAEALAHNDLDVGEIDLFVHHQANLRINERFADALDVPREKVFNTIEGYGNTTAATIPIGLYEARRGGRLERGTMVASAAFGSGFTWGAAIYRW